MKNLLVICLCAFSLMACSDSDSKSNNNGGLGQPVTEKSSALAQGLIKNSWCGEAYADEQNNQLVDKLVLSKDGKLKIEIYDATTQSLAMTVDGIWAATESAVSVRIQDQSFSANAKIANNILVLSYESEGQQIQDSYQACQ